MLLRSSSTPVLGSLLQSFSESPSNHHHHQSELHKHTPNSVHPKISCSNGGSQDFRKSLFHSSPSLAEIKGTTSGSRSGFRRVQSDGNLKGLADNVDEFSLAKKSGRRNSYCTLESIPSLSVHRLWTSFEDDSGDDEGIEEEEEEDGEYDYSPTMVGNLVLEQVGSNANGNGSLGLLSEGKMYLAAGIGALGVDFAAGDGNGGGGGGGRGSIRPVAFDRDGGDSRGVSMEEHYKRMLEENPGDPLFLRNYAQFLYEIKGDVGAAEEYYSRAILADQEDGETLSQYAEIIWEMHRDRERAAGYFERAVGASTQNSHIHAAYARFLWEAEEEEDEKEENAANSGAFLHHGFMAPATA